MEKNLQDLVVMLTKLLEVWTAGQASGDHAHRANGGSESAGWNPDAGVAAAGRGGNLGSAHKKTNIHLPKMTADDDP